MPPPVAVPDPLRHNRQVQSSDSPAYLLGLEIIAGRVPDFDQHPFSVPCIRSLNLSFRSQVTFLVGENGCGKSTLLEGIAALCRLPLSGGGRHDLAAQHGPRGETPLVFALRPRFRRQPRDSYFFRGEFSAHFASLLDQRGADPDFGRDPYASYGGKSLHSRSHGEGYLTLLNERIGEDGLYLLDEPEAALSPQRQLALLALLADRIRARSTQFVIATHSPILMTIPGAEILLIDGASISPTLLQDTEHYQVTKAVLQNPASFWRHLAGRD
jgi:predicted ATPase